MSSAINSTFDPFSQNITILMSDGITPVVLSLTDIDANYWYNAASSINFGAQFGACVVMFFVVLVLTKEQKRRTPIFILNILSLVFGALRALFLTLYSVSDFAKLYPTFAIEVPAIPRSAYIVSVVGSVMPLFMTVTVNLSLVLQAHTVTKGMNNMSRHIITGLACVVFFLAVGFRFAVTATNSEAIVSSSFYWHQEWITKGALITDTLAIWFFSLIFTGKLLYALYNRHRNGWKQWSGVRILAAMGGCTMIIPSTFAILEYVVVTEFPEAGTLALTMVALLLPLSSLWASMAIDQETSTLDLSHLSGSSTSSGGSEQRKMCGSQLSSSTAPSSRLEFNSDRKGSIASINPTTIDSRIEHVAPRDSTDLDLEAMGVRVDKSYSIQSRKGSTSN